MGNAEYPWFKFMSRDWLTDESVMTMPCIARGAYIQLLCCQWENESLPDEMVSLAMLARIHNRECAAYDHLRAGETNVHGDGWMPQNLLFEEEIWPYLEDRFPVCKDGRRRNPKLEQQRKQQIDDRQMLSQRGKKGGRKSGELRQLRTTASTQVEQKSNKASTQVEQRSKHRASGCVSSSSSSSSLEEGCRGETSLDDTARELLELWRESVNPSEPQSSAMPVLRARLSEGVSSVELRLVIERKAAEVRAEGGTTVPYKLKNFLREDGDWTELLDESWKPPAARVTDDEHSRFVKLVLNKLRGEQVGSSVITAEGLESSWGTERWSEVSVERLKALLGENP
jgi:hypothetical protein